MPFLINCFTLCFHSCPLCPVNLTQKSTIGITEAEDDNWKWRRTFVLRSNIPSRFWKTMLVAYTESISPQQQDFTWFRMAVCFSKNISPGSLAAKGGQMTQFWTMRQILRFSCLTFGNLISLSLNFLINYPSKWE